LDLLRQRLTTEQIARRLGLTLDGAKYHVSEIITKLGVSSREQAASWRAEGEARRLGALAARTLLFNKATSSTALKAAAGAGVVVVAGAIVLLALALLLNPYPKEAGLTDVPGDLGKLAYIRNGDLRVMTLPDGKPVRLTTEGQASYPRWSPSGGWLLAGESSCLSLCWAVLDLVIAGAHGLELHGDGPAGARSLTGGTRGGYPPSLPGCISWCYL